MTTEDVQGVLASTFRIASRVAGEPLSPWTAEGFAQLAYRAVRPHLVAFDAQRAALERIADMADGSHEGIYQLAHDALESTPTAEGT